MYTCAHAYLLTYLWLSNVRGWHAWPSTARWVKTLKLWDAKEHGTVDKCKDCHVVTSYKLYFALHLQEQDEFSHSRKDHRYHCQQASVELNNTAAFGTNLDGIDTNAPSYETRPARVRCVDKHFRAWVNRQEVQEERDSELSAGPHA